MKKNILQILALLVSAITLFSCDTLKSLPTNTTGGLFSLNGTWRLNSTTDSRSMVGTTIVVYPVVGNATVKSLANNTYCVREKDELWTNVKSNNAGGFTINNLVNSCNGTTVYKDATIAVVNTDKITVSTHTAAGAEVVQTWHRVAQQ